MAVSSPSNNENVPGLRLGLRGPFRLALEGYVKFLSPAFAQAGETQHFGVQARRMKIANPPSPPFSKGGLGGFESYFPGNFDGVMVG